MSMDTCYDEHVNKEKWSRLKYVRKLILHFFLDCGIGDLLRVGVLAGDGDPDQVLLVLLVGLEVADHEVARVDGLLVSPDSHCVNYLKYLNTVTIYKTLDVLCLLCP